MINKNVAEEAEHFLTNEKQFHLGMLPTELSNPKTADIDSVFADNTAAGVSLLLSVDCDVAKMAQRVLAGPEFVRLVVSGVETIMKGGRIVFSGCGATGRLSILLEAMWRHFFIGLKSSTPDLFNKVSKYENSVLSIMTGGDFALIRSVESFEDYVEFGKQQARDLSLTPEDLLIAITEGGETSSVLGTVEYAAGLGSKVFLMFNNPSDILCEHIERSRKAIEDPRVTVLDLYCGPMAIAGSTRMQATTSEQLVAGAALEKIMAGGFEQVCSAEEMAGMGFQEYDCAACFSSLVEELRSKFNTEQIAEMIEFEAGIYKKNGLVTYYADSFLLDIFTDTTERAPTFMLPPFRKFDDHSAPVSWAFVKTPELPTVEAWHKVLGRSPRCLEWDSEIYRSLNGAEQWVENPPRLNKNELAKFMIGNEPDDSRIMRTPNVAILVVSGSEASSRDFVPLREAFTEYTSSYTQSRTLIVGDSQLDAHFKIQGSWRESPLRLMEHMAMKLVLNTISTGTMVLLGRVTGNWMSWVEVSNKKLQDRGIRLISQVCNISYRQACYALFETIVERRNMSLDGQEKLSPVQITIDRIAHASGKPSA